MSLIAMRAIWVTRSFVIVEGPRVSPAIMTRLVVASVSAATRMLQGSTPALAPSRKKRSTISSEMRSQTLSGWPSDTDSLVNKYDCRDTQIPARFRTNKFGAVSLQAYSCWSSESYVTAPLELIRARSVGFVVARHRADEVHQRSADFGIGDPHEGFVELDTFPAAQEIDDVVVGRTLGEACGRHKATNAGSADPARCLIVEELDADAENLREIE